MMGEKSVEQLAESILAFLASYLGFHAGALFKGEGGEFKRVATLGVPADAPIPERFSVKEGLLGHMLELLPMLGEVKILRQWAGMADMTPDFSPVMGLTPVENYYIDSGWGTWGFKATPVCGMTMAHTIATGEPHDLIKPFNLDRFVDFAQVGEKGAASVGH